MELTKVYISLILFKTLWKSLPTPEEREDTEIQSRDSGFEKHC